MRIISLNIDYGSQGSILYNYLAKQSHSETIYCLQEVSDDAHDCLRSLLGASHISYYHQKYIGNEKFLLATFVPKHFKVRNVFKLLENSEGQGFVQKMDILHGSTNVTLANIHGFPRPGDKLDTEDRIEQVRELIRNLQGRNTIIIGDFNLNANSYCLQLLEKEGYVHLLKTISMPTTRNELVWKRFPDSKQLHADYAFISKDLYDKFSVKFTVESPIVSDHQPLLLELL